MKLCACALTLILTLLVAAPARAQQTPGTARLLRAIGEVSRIPAEELCLTPQDDMSRAVDEELHLVKGTIPDIYPPKPVDFDKLDVKMRKLQQKILQGKITEPECVRAILNESAKASPWAGFDPQERYDLFRESMISAREKSNEYFPPDNVLTCLAYKESSFEPAAITAEGCIPKCHPEKDKDCTVPFPPLTARGMMQQTRSTTEELLRLRKIGNQELPEEFRTKTADEIQDMLGNNPDLQIALSIFTLKSKRMVCNAGRETGLETPEELEENKKKNKKKKKKLTAHAEVECTLRLYYGNPSAEANKEYAKTTMDCARCLDKVDAGAKWPPVPECLILTHPKKAKEKVAEK